MSRIFISHSSRDQDDALAVQAWLAENGWGDVFLDFDAKRGIAAGERWKSALQKAAYQCEVVLALVSPDWIASPWCKAEVNAAQLLGKRTFIVLIGVDKSQIPLDLCDEQWVDLKGDPDGYARLREGLKRAGLHPSSFPFESGRRPYPGLSPLDVEDAAIFFGRDAEIVRGLDKMRSLARNRVERLLLILGASGSGKSSFLRAGLWPRLNRDEASWVPILPIRPERAVLSGKFGLAHALQQISQQPIFADVFISHGLPRTRAAIEELIKTEGDGLLRLVDALHQGGVARTAHSVEPARPTVVLSIDQGEELFNDEQQEGRQFIDALTHALKHHQHIVTVIAVRSDAFPRFQADHTLAEVPKESLTLDMMLQGSYRTVIEEPAKLVSPKSLKIDPLLTHALLEDMKGQDALPLLAFALERLYDGYGSGGELTLNQYEKLGRMAGVIEGAIADAFVDGVASGDLPKEPTAQIALARRAFIPHLAQVNSAGEFVRRVATIDEIPPSALPVIERFAERRLLVRDRRTIGGQENDVVEVAHEALLRQWQELNNALQEERSFLFWLSRIKIDAEQYFQLHADKAHTALLNDFSLNQATEWFRKKSEYLSEEVKDFIKISASVASSAKRHNRIVDSIARFMVPSVIGMVAIGAFAFFMYMLSAWIMGIINLNDNTNICFQNENESLRTTIRAIARREIEPDDPRIIRLLNANVGAGTRHRCYRIKEEQ